MSKTILVVEDDTDILDILFYILIDADYQVIRWDGSNVTRMIADLQPDLVLMDHRLGEQWGAEICLELKTSEATSGIPVIMMSATVDLAEIAETAGANDYLAKPFDLDEVLEKVRWHLEGVRIDA